MASDPHDGYTVIDRGKDLLGQRWEVGVRGPGLVVRASGAAQPSHELCFDGELLSRFAEAVARAATPGQVSGNSAATCWHCRKPIARCDSVPGQHIGCGSGCGWIHTDPEQWGHSCEPRSGAPYAQPAAQVRVNHGPACGCTPCLAEPSYAARRRDDLAAMQGQTCEGGC